MSRSLLATGGALVSVVVACTLTTDLDGLSGSASGSPDGGSKPDASRPDAGPTVFDLDGGHDAATAETVAGGGVVIASGASAYAAGAAQQHHVHYAQNLKLWVVFYYAASDSDFLRTRLTADFVTFEDGPAIGLPQSHDDDGREFDVAYASIAGSDVFHIAYSTIAGGTAYSYHTRGRGWGATLTFDAPSLVGTNPVEYDTQKPDGPSITILHDGHVAFSSGYNQVNGRSGNAVAFVSMAPDDGGETWSHELRTGNEVEAAARSVNARAMVTTPTGVRFAWERADFEPQPKTIGFSSYTLDGGTWSPPVDDDPLIPAVFYDVDDWSAVADTTGTIFHGMRFANGTYTHLYDDGTEHAGPPVPTAPHSQGDGLVLVPSGGAVAALALNAPDKALRASRYVAGAWTAWQTIADADSARAHISANAGIVMWERAGALVGMRLPPP